MKTKTLIAVLLLGTLVGCDHDDFYKITGDDVTGYGQVVLHCGAVTDECPSQCKINIKEVDQWDPTNWEYTLNTGEFIDETETAGWHYVSISVTEYCNGGSLSGLTTFTDEFYIADGETFETTYNMP